MPGLGRRLRIGDVACKYLAFGRCLILTFAGGLHRGVAALAPSRECLWPGGPIRGRMKINRCSIYIYMHSYI